MTKAHIKTEIKYKCCTDCFYKAKTTKWQKHILKVKFKIMTILHTKSDFFLLIEAIQKN